MPKIFNIVQFRNDTKKALQTLSGDEKFMFIANEMHRDRSFIAVTPSFFSDLCRKCGLSDTADLIEDMQEQVKKNLSARQKRARLKG